MRSPFQLRSPFQRAAAVVAFAIAAIAWLWLGAFSATDVNPKGDWVWRVFTLGSFGFLAIFFFLGCLWAKACEEDRREQAERDLLPGH